MRLWFEFGNYNRACIYGCLGPFSFAIGILWWDHGEQDIVGSPHRFWAAKHPFRIWVRPFNRYFMLYAYFYRYLPLNQQGIR